MGETIDARIAFLQRQLHAISLATQEAKARNDQVAIDTLGQLYNKVRADVLALQVQAKAEDMPPALLVTLDNMTDEAVRVGKQLTEAGANIIGGIGATLKYLPLILLAVLLVVGLVYAGKIRKDLQ